MLNLLLTKAQKTHIGEKLVSSVNGAGKVDIHTQANESEFPKVKTTVCAILLWGLKMLATFFGNNMALRELIKCI